MANKQTRSLRKLGLAMKTVPGAQDPFRRTMGCAKIVEAPVYKGRACQTSFEHKSAENKRKSAWLGARRKDIKFTREG